MENIIRLTSVCSEGIGSGTSHADAFTTYVKRTEEFKSGKIWKAKLNGLGHPVWLVEASLATSLYSDWRGGTTEAPPIQSLRTMPKGTQLLGDIINFRGLIYAPTNEEEVKFLFATLAVDLGFRIDALRTPFPDCLAHQKVKEGWFPVRIEFEFESKNFLVHEHPLDGCDIIVCWHNNWADCPVKVIELSKEKLIIS